MAKAFDLEAYKARLKNHQYKESRPAFIYKIQNKINGKVYIGRTIRPPEVRFKEHIRGYGCRKSRSLIHEALNREGVDNFVFEIVCVTTEKAVDYVESNYIEYYKCLAPTGYNCIKFYNSAEVCEDTKLRMSRAKKGKSPWNKGKKLPPAWNLGKHNASGCKPIISINMIDGTIKHYPSSAEAVRNGFNSGHVTQCCKGKLKHHKGYYWHYADQGDRK